MAKVAVMIRVKWSVFGTHYTNYVNQLSSNSQYSDKTLHVHIAALICLLWEYGKDCVPVHLAAMKDLKKHPH